MNQKDRPSRLLTRAAIVVGASLALGGCSLGYYWQAMRGHMELMDEREPVDAVLADPQTPAATRAQLELSQQAVDFAHAILALPDNGSYRQYADLSRDYLVWNVVAAPEWSLEPRTWCFPVAGCVSYRGYFAEADARSFAELRKARGDDVFVGGVSAYSTLGRFADPLTNAMLRMPDYQLAGLIFHELAHQQLYLAGDSAFNESFASAVEQAGIRRWLIERGERSALCGYERWLVRRERVRGVLDRGRRELEQLYARTASKDELAAGKAEAMAGMRAEYDGLRAGWTEPPWFDGWFGPGMNNATLAALATYDAHVPAFAELLRRAGGDFPTFYKAAAKLADMEAGDRAAALQELERAAVKQSPPGCPETLAGRDWIAD
jgi:predicted aminopeptidase